jgi:hypothetical protein
MQRTQRALRRGWLKNQRYMEEGREGREIQVHKLKPMLLGGGDA